MIECRVLRLYTLVNSTSTSVSLASTARNLNAGVVDSELHRGGSSLSTQGTPTGAHQLDIRVRRAHAQLCQPLGGFSSATAGPCSSASSNSPPSSRHSRMPSTIKQTVA